MHKPEFVLENEMHKIIWYLEKQMDHLIRARKSGLVLTRKKSHLVDFSVPVDHSGNKRKQTDRQITGSCQRAKKKLWNMKKTMIPTAVGTLGILTKILEKGLK